MRTRNRKRAVLVSVRGGLMVVLAVVLHAAGLLDPLESMEKAGQVRFSESVPVLLSCPTPRGK